MTVPTFTAAERRADEPVMEIGMNGSLQAQAPSVPTEGHEPVVVAWRAKLGNDPDRQHWTLCTSDPTGEPGWHSVEPLYSGALAGEAYQVIGAVASAGGLFGHPDVDRALDYFADPKGEILPFLLVDQCPQTATGIQGDGA